MAELPEYRNGKRILIVDDEAVKRDAVSQVVSRYGFSCDYAVNTDEAWGKLTAAGTKYEMMVTDNSMITRESAFSLKDMSFGNEGIQLIKRVRENPALKGLEIIMYSGSGAGPQARALGAKFIGMELSELVDILEKKYGEKKERPVTPHSRKWWFIGRA